MRRTSKVLAISSMLGCFPFGSSVLAQDGSTSPAPGGFADLRRLIRPH